MLPLAYRIRTKLYNASSWMLRTWYVRGLGMDIGIDCRISRSARLDRTNPRGVHIGDHTLVSFDAAILTHDFVGGRHVDTFVGSNCFIGARAMVMPGVRIGKHSFVTAHALVAQDMPENSLVSGTPAKRLCKASDMRLKGDVRVRAYPWNNRFVRGYPNQVVEQWANGLEPFVTVAG